MAHSITKKCFALLITGVILVMIAGSCSHYDDIMKNGRESSSEGNSHNAGRNCMNCHHDDANQASWGDKWWYFAGTVFHDKGNAPASSSGAIELWTGPGRTGERLYQVQVDRSGNFYTAKIFSFKGGFYPVFVGNDGTIKEMTTKTTEGACNSCHGVTEEHIEINQ